MTANKKATMQQLVLLTGFSEYALTGAGKNQLPPYTMSFPCIAFRSGDAKLTYPNGQNGHEMRLGHGDTLPESLFTWTGVAKDVVTVPDDAVLSDWGQYIPKDERAEITGAWVDEKPIEIKGKEITGQMLEARAEVVVEDQWILDAGWQPVCSNPWVVIDRENNYIFEIPPMMPERDAKGIGNLLCTAPELYAALKSARELLSRIYLDDRFDYNHVALEIMNANAALAKAVGKGGEDGSI